MGLYIFSFKTFGLYLYLTVRNRLHPMRNIKGSLSVIILVYMLDIAGSHWVAALKDNSGRTCWLQEGTFVANDGMLYHWVHI
jgi:hypothetical protein